MMSLLLFPTILQAASTPVPQFGLPNHTWVFTSRIWSVLHALPPDYGTAGAYAMSLLVLTSLGVWWHGRLARRARAFQTVTGKGFRPRPIPLGAWKWPATLMIFAPLSNVWVQRLGSKVVVTTGLLIVTTALALFGVLRPDSTTLVVIGVTVLLGLGMANVLAPCTDSIMGSLPRAKAGVGSAVNDTTRQMGGAVGVAVFGSLMASHYRSSITSRLDASLPGGLLHRVWDNVGQAVGVSASPQARPYAPHIASAAKDSFVSGLHLIGFLAAGITLVAAIGVALFLPARAIDDTDDTPVPTPVAPEYAADRA